MMDGVERFRKPACVHILFSFTRFEQHHARNGVFLILEINTMNKNKGIANG